MDNYPSLSVSDIHSPSPEYYLVVTYGGFVKDANFVPTAGVERRSARYRARAQTARGAMSAPDRARRPERPLERFFERRKGGRGTTP